MEGYYAICLLEVQASIAIGQKIVYMGDFKVKVSNIPRVVFLKGMISLRATEYHALDSGRLNHLNVALSQLFEKRFIAVPQCVMAAAAFVFHDSRMNAHCVQKLDHISGTKNGARLDVSENDVEIGPAPDKIYGVAGVINTDRLVDPESTMLLYVGCVHFHYGLQYAMMSGDAGNASRVRFVTK
jgi:hypothetical protein